MLRAAKFQGGIKLHNKYFHKVMLIFFIILVGIAGFSFAEVTDNVVIRNTGRITPEIMAESGYWRDIQDAVDLAASLGGGIVHIPAGIWNFVNVGESWTGARVIIPAGVSLFGAPTERYPNGSVVEWKTVLVMPWDMPGDNSWMPPHWFRVQGNSDPNKPSRFSDIKLVGYREIDPDSTQLYRGIVVDSVINFRIDHCYFRHIPEGILTMGLYCCGVIDHNVFDNVYGWHGGTVWAERTIGYGIAVNRAVMATTEWPDLTEILGKYTNFTVFIEDNVFTKWRHCTVGNDGAHFVFRRNKVIGGFAYNEVDQHPRYSGQEPYVPCRAGEVYENQFVNPVSRGICIHLFAGGGVYFNNTLVGYGEFMHISDSSWGEMVNPHDIYIWDNNIGGANLISGDAVLDEDYFLNKPNWYTPYPYPHPLTTP